MNYSSITGVLATWLTMAEQPAGMPFQNIVGLLMLFVPSAPVSAEALIYWLVAFTLAADNRAVVRDGFINREGHVRGFGVEFRLSESIEQGCLYGWGFVLTGHDFLASDEVNKIR